MTARPLFIGGTSSNAGKSWMATAICAWLRATGCVRRAVQSAEHVEQFVPVPGGGEIGRAQVAQAEACGLEPEPAMNPILLKPNGRREPGCGERKIWKNLSARDYYEHFGSAPDRARRV